METKRKWYQLTRVWIIAGLLLISAASGSSDKGPDSDVVENKYQTISLIPPIQ